MSNISRNGVGIASLIAAMLYVFGVEVDIDTIENAIAASVVIFNLGLLIINQVERPDITKFFIKK
jgi:uncharacterized membrane protein